MKPSCQSTQVVKQSKLSINPSCQSSYIVNQSKLSINQSCQSNQLPIMQPKLSIYLSGHESKLSIRQPKLSITSSCQLIQIVNHLDRQPSIWTDRHTVINFEISVPKQKFRKKAIVLFSIIKLTLEPKCNLQTYLYSP